MSIILDALKRSDRERRLQKPPDLSQIYQENHPPRKKAMVWVVLIGVVLIAGFSAAYLLFQKDPVAENGKRPERAVVDAGKKETPAEKPKTLRSFSRKSEGTEATQKRKNSGKVSRRSAMPVPTRGRPNPRANTRNRNLEPVKEVSGDSAGGSPFAAILAKATRVVEETKESNKGDTGKGTHPLSALFSKSNKSGTGSAGNRKAVPTPVKPKQSVPDSQVNAPAPAAEKPASLSKPESAVIPEPEIAQVEKSKPGPENQAREEVVKHNSVPPPPPPPAPKKKNTVAPSGGGKITLMDDLPYETRQKYEGLKINVHIYDEKSAERRVFINMNSYKEGEKIEEDGPLLVAIIPEGIIVDYGEGKVRMNVKN